jgi:hypothetical protein
MAEALVAAVAGWRGPLAREELKQAEGWLALVTTCGTGRHARFQYVVTDKDRAFSHSEGCPSPLYEELQSAAGQRVRVLYAERFRAWPTPKIEVYVIDSAGRTFRSYEQSAANRRNHRVALVVLSLLQAGMALMVLLIVWLQLKGQRTQSLSARHASIQTQTRSM